MNEDALLNIYEQTHNLRKESENILNDLLDCGERYSDLESLTSGGMKEVFKCYDTHTDSQVILLTPKSDDLSESFIREGRITSYLQHPNIMPVDDMGLLKESQPFFTTKFFPGMDFDQYLQTPKALPHLIGIFIKVCDAIHYAHSHGVVHLDLKPANIRIGSFGEVLVADWGISELIYEVTDAETSYLDKDLQKILLYRKPPIHKSLSGTPGYIAPERYNEQTPQKASDIYSLGAMLYEILTGEPPTKSVSLTFAENTPQGLIAICQKALQPSIEDRYKNMSDFVTDLNRYLHGFATLAENAGILRQLHLFYHRNKRFCLIAFIALGLICTTIGLAFNSTESSRKIAEAEKEQAILAREETQKVLIDLKEEQRTNKQLMQTASKSHLEIARQKLHFSQFEAMYKNLDLAKKLALSKEVLEFEAKLALASFKWTKAEKLFGEINNRQGQHFCNSLAPKSASDLSPILADIELFLKRDFMLLFLRNCLSQNIDLISKVELYSYYLRVLHVGLKHPPTILSEMNQNGTSITFKKALAVKNVGVLHLLSPHKVNLSGSGLIYETGLNECDQLLELDISHTGMLGAGALHIKNLKKLNVSHTSFNDSRQFQGMPSLEVIDVSFTRIQNFEGFKTLQLLKKLMVDSSQYKNARYYFPHLEIQIKK